MRKKIFPPLSSIIRRRKLPWLLHLYKHFFLEMTTKQLKNHPGKMPHPDGGDGSVKVAKAWPQTHLLHQLHWREGPHDHLISGIQMCTNPKTLHHPGQLLLLSLGGSKQESTVHGGYVKQHQSWVRDVWHPNTGHPQDEVAAMSGQIMEEEWKQWLANDPQYQG